MATPATDVLAVITVLRELSGSEGASSNTTNGEGQHGGTVEHRLCAAGRTASWLKSTPKATRKECAMTTNSIDIIVRDQIEGTSSSTVGVRLVDRTGFPATSAGGRASRNVWLPFPRTLGLAAAALLFLAGTVTSASAANACVKG